MIMKIAAIIAAAAFACGPSYDYSYEPGHVTWTSMGTAGSGTGEAFEGAVVEKTDGVIIHYACRIAVKGDDTGEPFTGFWGFSMDSWGQGPCWALSGTSAWLMWQTNLDTMAAEVIAMRFAPPEHP
jgi:hypothetical protein